MLAHSRDLKGGQFMGFMPEAIRKQSYVGIDGLIRASKFGVNVKKVRVRHCNLINDVTT